MHIIFSVWLKMVTATQNVVPQHEAEKRNQFSFVCISFYYLTETGKFFTYTGPKESRSINYNSVYLTLACTENFSAIVTLSILCLQVKR